jgi:hypothetical protein
MGYNLWLSEDSQYTLGSRIGTQESATPGPVERETDRPDQPSSAEMDRIDFLMETLARRLETASLGSSDST